MCINEHQVRQYGESSRGIGTLKKAVYFFAQQVIYSVNNRRHTKDCKLRQIVKMFIFFHPRLDLALHLARHHQYFRAKNHLTKNLEYHRRHLLHPLRQQPLHCLRRY
ncbi:MAG: hypothetical protein ACI8VC_000827 [Candidatus Endobugula sp.]|jgi:hypothetical protein